MLRLGLFRCRGRYHFSAWREFWGGNVGVGIGLVLGGVLCCVSVVWDALAVARVWREGWAGGLLP